jgi:prepilin-type N-terminal cleavage/methylation domain-containing protein
MKMRRNAGFTLLEILLVVAAIAILAGIVIVAINPAQQLAETRDAQRRSDVQTISSAIIQYTIKNGHLPDNFPTAAEGTCIGQNLKICKRGVSCGGIELDNDLVPDFIAAIPTDPSSSELDFTGYMAYRLPDPSTRVVVCHPYSETGNGTISVTR